MTTILAKILIDEAMKNDQITEECAKYFNDLLEANRFHTFSGDVFVNQSHYTITTENEFNFFNGTNPQCTLGQIGKVYKTINGTKFEDFNVLKYIKQTSFENGKVEGEGTSTAYLANIIGQEFVGLDGYVHRELFKDDLSIEEWLKIKNYLEETYDTCAKRDVGRTNYVKNLIRKIDLKVKKFTLQEELDEIETNPPQYEDADYLIHKIATLRKEIAQIEL